jgi:hypothetical protein
MKTYWDATNWACDHADAPLRQTHRSRDLMWHQEAVEFNAPDYQKWMDTQRTFAPGDDVTTLDETLQGRVLDMKDRVASVLINFMGFPRVYTLDVDKLRAVQ